MKKLPFAVGSVAAMAARAWKEGCAIATRRARAPIASLARSSALGAAALLLSAGALRAGLVLEVKPADYNTGTLQWPIASGSMAGDYFACAPWSPVSVTTMIHSDGLSYKAVDFTAAGSILGGPLCPTSLGGASSRTIEAWCYQPVGANGDAMTIIDLSRQNGPENSNFAFCNSLYNRSIWSPPYSEGWNADNAVRSGKWVHLVASYDGTTLNLYVNGAPDRVGITHAFATESGGSISIGMMRWTPTAPDTTPHSTANGDGWNAWRGYLGSIRVYDEARTAGQVSADYALGVNYGETGVGLPKITASVSGSHGSISPSGVVYVTSGNNQAFTFTADLGYKIADVLVDGASNPAAVLAGSYTFTTVVADHTIVVSFEELPKQTVAGKVTNGAAGIPGAKVYFKTSPNASVSPTFTTTTVDAAGNYSILLPPGNWYATANEIHYFTPADVTFTVAASPVPLADIVLTANPNWKILFSLNTADLSAIGDGERIFSWAGYNAYETYNNGVSPLLGPTVEIIDGVKWERNVRASYDDTVSPTVDDRGDGFSLGTSAADIVTEGVTIVAAVKPQYKAVGGEQRGEIVDIFYNELFLAVNHGNGEVTVCTRGYAQHSTGYFIPDGQKTILSLVVAPTGGITLFANGIQQWSYASGVDYTSLKLSWANAMAVGRNAYDGWSAFNGAIGDVFVYRTALTGEERAQLEYSLRDKFIPAAVSTTALALTGGADPSAAGTPVTFTATVTGSSPGGAVTFYDGASVIGTVALSAGQASVTTSTLATGVRSITASYAGDWGNAASTSASLSHTVTEGRGPSTTVLTLGAGPNPSYPGQAITLTATVTGSGTPTGDVTFQDGASVLGTVALDGAGQASLPTSALALGAHSLTAEYAGDPANQPGTSAPLDHTVAETRAVSTVSLGSSANPSVIGVPVTFTATVTGSGVPSGVVTFKEGATELGTGACDGSGRARITIALYDPAGARTLTAEYAGDSNNRPGTSAPLSQTVNARSAPPRTGDLLFSVVTESLPASGPTGAWPTYLPSGQTLTTQGSPTVDTLSGTRWARNIYADGDGFTQARYAAPLACSGVTIVAAVKPAYIAVGGEPRGEIVDIFHDRLALAISHTDGRVMVARNYWNDWGPAIPDGQSTVLSLVVQIDGSYQAYANGVEIMSGGANGDWTSINPDHTAQWGSDPDFTHYITLGRNAPDGWSTYNGHIGDVFVYTTALNDAERAQVEYSVRDKFVPATASTTTLALAAGTNPSHEGKPVTFTATVTGAAPTGNVVFYDGATAIGAGSLDGAGKVSLVTTTLLAGTHSITAQYAGDFNNTSGASGALTQTVTTEAGTMFTIH